MGIAEGSLLFNKIRLKIFVEICEVQSINQGNEITSSFIRYYFLYFDKEDIIQEAGIVPSESSGLYWYKNVVFSKDWINPTHRVKAPIVLVEPVEPVSFETISELVKV